MSISIAKACMWRPHGMGIVTCVWRCCANINIKIKKKLKRMLILNLVGCQHAFGAPIVKLSTLRLYFLSIREVNDYTQLLFRIIVSSLRYAGFEIKQVYTTKTVCTCSYQHRPPTHRQRWM